MNFLKRLFSIKQLATQPWWLKVRTQMPPCTYYFGPFSSQKEAKLLQAGYVDDLRQEGAKNILTALERTQPEILTSCASE